MARWKLCGVIDLEVAQGEIFGSDRSRWRGQDLHLSDSRRRDGSNVRRSRFSLAAQRVKRAPTAGYLTQVFSLYHDLSVAENIRYIGDLRRVSSGRIEERGSRYLQMFDMDRFRDRLAGRLSGGMKQKLRSPVRLS